MDAPLRNVSATSAWLSETSLSPLPFENAYGNHRTAILEIFLWTFSITSLYVLISLLWYENALSTRRNRTARSRGKSKKNKVYRKYGMYLRVVNITAVALLFVRTIVEHVEVLYERFTEYDLCSKVVTLKVILAGLFFTAVYAFLWLRQRMCYSNPTMSHLTTDFIHKLSRASVVALLMAEMITVGLFVFTRSYKRSSVGCVIQNTSVPPFIVWLVYGITTAAFQLAFLALFLYPLHKQRKHMKAHKTCSDRAHKIMPVIRRSLLACAVCVVTNLVVSVSLIFANEPYNVVPIILYNMNLQINSVAVVASFSRWRFILLPCLRRKCHVSNLEEPRVMDTEAYSGGGDQTRQRDNLLVLLSLEPSTSIFTISTNSAMPRESRRLSKNKVKKEDDRPIKAESRKVKKSKISKISEEAETVT